MKKYYTVHFAQAYGEGAYGACEYNDTTACPTSGGSTGGTTTPAAGAGSGQLTDTGLAIVALVTLAAVLMLTAIVVRVWRRGNKKVATERAVAPGNNSVDH